MRGWGVLGVLGVLLILLLALSRVDGYAAVAYEQAKQCQDGQDNDGDGYVDHPADPHCDSANRDSEAPDPDPQPQPSAESTPEQPVAAAEAAPRLEPFPVVRLQGRLTRHGARVNRLSVTAPSGSIVRIHCHGVRCKRRSVRAVVKFTGLRVRPAQRRYVAGDVLEVYVTAPGMVGKFTRFRIRRGRAPARTDGCAAPAMIGFLPSRVPCN